MGRSFASIGAFVTFLGRRVATLPTAQRHALGKASAVVLEDAQGLPGHYLLGWPALQPETVARKATGDSPLLETGALRDSYGRRVVSAYTAVIGSDDPKALWQECGTARGIPPRPVLKAAAVRKEGEVRSIIARVVTGHLVGTTSRR